MKRHATLYSLVTFVALFALSAPGPAVAKHYKHYKSKKASTTIWIGHYGRLHSWQAVGKDKLIIWASPNRPYLVRIHRPHRSLRFARRLGVTSTVGRVTRFDRIIVDGWSVPIKSIRALDRPRAERYYARPYY